MNYLDQFLNLLLFCWTTKILLVSCQSAAKSNVALSDEEIERRITQNVVKLAATDQLNSEIITNRTRAYLSCESGEMIVKINFSEPFRGIGYSDYDRTSPCKFYGDGSRYYEMRLPLKGCGTKQEAPRLFINNIILRFHRTLELEEDEIKTIVCRYPPPLAPPPPSLAAPILEAPPPAVLPIPAKLSEVELLLIISALLFLTLLLLGIGMAYYCLKRRNIKVVRKRKIHTPSEITKVSLIEPVHIPRVAVSTSSSEYPSSVSVISETSTIRRDHYGLENMAFIPEPYPMDIEREESFASLPVPVIAKPNITQLEYLTTIRETQHLTDTDVFDTRHLKTTTQLYKKVPSIEAPSLYGSIPDNDDWSYSELEEMPEKRPYVKPPRLDARTLEDYYRQTQHMVDIDEDITRHKRLTYPKPVITTQTVEDVYRSRPEEIDITEDTTTERITTYPKPKITTKTTEDRYLSPRETTDITEDTTVERITRYPGPSVTEKTEEDRFVGVREETEMIDDTSTRKLVKYPIPKYVVHTTDDTFITKISETETTQHVVKSGKKEAPPPPRYLTLPTTTRRADWESQITRILVGPAEPTTELPETKTTTTETTEQYIRDIRDQTLIDRRVDTSTVDERVSSAYQYTGVRPPPRPTKIDVIYRVIDSPPPDLPGVERLTTDVRTKLRTVITTDEVFRTSIIESTTIEEYYRISRDVRWEPLFEPPVWTTIIHLFSSDEVVSAPLRPESPESRPPPLPTRYRRRGSLPSISGDLEPYEPPVGRFDSIRSRRTSRSGSIFDVRSLTEEDVTFTRGESIRFSRTSLGYPLRPSARYLEDVPIPSPSPTRPSIWRTTHLSEFVVPPERPYSPEIDALSLEVTPRTYTSSRYVSSYGQSSAAYDRLARIRRTLDRTASIGEKEETKSTTEKDVYDWKRY